ncbi:MAG: EVE domain-containing protein [Sphingomonas sp.]|jgi:predicted RNA-binding protein with PUA-like domain|uniref:EVE domain-containing protein n=1 Tax=Sphingomonas lycopersici TaxID=2951807 RepID=A0AA41ZCK4_9SPHN|nr:MULTISPECIES: EVE domain-containing protein [Sphingomonas]MBV8239109.1 EVE domain-containing protein [Sphingomonas sp.]MCW6537194.1 EVE domain-containing protein [Sphingomonas lycopersici]OJU19385.1 MAG: ubiquinol-cytochrome C reductase [Sphingomonas sp. 66-10]
MAHWLLKSEPESYSWDDLVRDGGTEWDGVRNNAAALHLRAMQPGDRALIYHSGGEKAAVGVAEITRAARKDGDEGNWVSVAIRPIAPLPHPVTLAAMKAEPALAGLQMLRQSRLSVSPVGDAEWKTIEAMAAR